MEATLTPADVEILMTTHNISRFDELNKYAERLVAPRLLGTDDRRIISQVMRTHVIASAVEERNQTDNGHRGICLFTAYTEDYTIGKLVDTVNRSYANRHGYHYINHTLSYEEMLLSIGPHKKHCTWYKVLLLNQLLNDAVMLQQHQIQYIMWIDADALVINPDVRVEDIIQRGGERDLIVAENMHAGCLINAGVLLVRVTEWSRQLWREVWACNKYDDVFFYEQSALIRRLRARREGLELLPSGVPFHSYLPGAYKGPKLFAHVAVLPHLELNTNSGWVQIQDSRVVHSQRRRIEKAKRRLKAHSGHSSSDVEQSVLAAAGSHSQSQAAKSSLSASSSSHLQSQSPLHSETQPQLHQPSQAQLQSQSQLHQPSQAQSQSQLSQPQSFPSCVYSPPSADDPHNQAPENDDEEIGVEGEGEQQKQEDNVCNQQVNQEHTQSLHTKQQHKKGHQKGVKNTSEGPPASSSAAEKDEDAVVYAKYLTGLEMPHFIFHAAGHCAKLEALKGMIEKCHLVVPQAYLDIESFKLDRDMKMLKNQGIDATIQALRLSSQQEN